MKIVKLTIGIALSMAIAATITSCSEDDSPEQNSSQPTEEITPDEPTEIELSEILGAWEAEGDRWDLDEGVSRCYQMTDDGNDFAMDDDGNYLVLASIREYCEQYANDYNADPNNSIKGTPEDFANHSYADSYMFTNINITENNITIYSGQRIENGGTLAILCVSGSYTYDQETGTFTVEDKAIESDPRTLTINVFKDDQNRMNFRYSDYDMYLTPSYDKTKKYYVYAPMIYYCQPGSAYTPSN